MIKINANERFTAVEQCRMFNVDISDQMDPKDIRGNNKTKYNTNNRSGINFPQTNFFVQQFQH